VCIPFLISLSLTRLNYNTGAVGGRGLIIDKIIIYLRNYLDIIIKKTLITICLNSLY